MKICFAASSGGHFEQLMKLKPLMGKYDSFVLTEKTNIDYNMDGIPTYYVEQINRKEKGHIFKFIKIFISSAKIFFKEKPDAIVTTGVLATIPMAIMCKIFRRKVIYIESFAKINSPTLTGKLMYKFADLFLVQWESMKKFYPKAIYGGGIY
ncbi:Oligosaccharide biosynthesis protein Alg14 like [Clostridium cavendishii DSM 21758]|uniref:Oligosaccharide biosynthesis protein Alg14 like n=1 Tax=Clostridium cavendishii DSM 21758 TaxID=1121302 RepID=A0A1M6Q9C6_9CLOT|nr:PssD/Cps14F family polysaccharide biosynthesis glycosyltransferase [Clostridium cavendishii]SHK16894.1 Oligosaccharide biosynthesis protein Alg14 like [Clostridium cavendishii DSM 21758]